MQDHQVRRLRGYRTLPMRVAVQHHPLVRHPALHRIGAAAGAVGLQPAIAQIAVGLVRLHRLGVDHRGHGGGQGVQEEGRRHGLVDPDLQRAVVDRPDPVRGVVGGEAELGQDEGRRLVQPHRALQRPGGVLRRHRVAAGEGLAGLQREAPGQPVIGDRPGFGQVADDGRVGGAAIADQLAVQVAGHLADSRLERLGRVQRDELVDLLGHHDGVARRAGEGRAEGWQKQEGAEQRRHEASHGTLLERIRLDDTILCNLYSIDSRMCIY